MTDPKKPSKNEDEYFAKLDAELMARNREKDRLERDEAERKSHYMKCPKTGHDLVTTTIHGVQVDSCPVCGGLWLDAGELDTLLAHEEPGFFKKVFGDMATGMRRGRRDHG
jgi:hypothetical protein